MKLLPGLVACTCLAAVSMSILFAAAMSKSLQVIIAITLFSYKSDKFQGGGESKISCFSVSRPHIRVRISTVNSLL
jgi:hypothetical protein